MKVVACVNTHHYNEDLWWRKHQKKLKTGVSLLIRKGKFQASEKNSINDNLAELFKKAWKLSSPPMITDVYVAFIESKQLRLNSIEMLETQISIGSTSTVQNTDKTVP